jgi:hypothetical protein
MEHRIARAEQIETTALSQQHDPPIVLQSRDVSAALGADGIGAKPWYFELDDVPYQGQTEQEEFSIKFGRSRETEIFEMDPGAFSVTDSRICLGGDRGIILAAGAPAVDGDGGLDPHALQACDDRS